jgi:iron complex transport system ATP-binding protein
MGFLEIKNLKSGYLDKPVIEDISFSIEKGEFMGIIGPNGAGKTTLLKTLTQIIRPMQGNILFEGRDIHRMGSFELAKRFAMVGQDLVSIFSFTVDEIVLMGRTPHIGVFGCERRQDLEIAQDMIRLTDLDGFKEKPINEMSAGERQRVLIARALTQQPQLLLLDEPTAHLDIGYQTEILDLVKSLKKKNDLTVICVLHDLNLASQYCDRILLLDKGKITGLGPPRDILKHEIIKKIFNVTALVDDKQFPDRPLVIPLSKTP